MGLVIAQMTVQMKIKIIALTGGDALKTLQEEAVSCCAFVVISYIARISLSQLQLVSSVIAHTL